MREVMISLSRHLSGKPVPVCSSYYRFSVCISLSPIQGRPKKWGHRLMTIILSPTYGNSSYPRVRLRGSPPRPASLYLSANGDAGGNPESTSRQPEKRKIHILDFLVHFLRLLAVCWPGVQ